MSRKPGCVGTFHGLGDEASEETQRRRAEKRAYYAAHRQKFIAYGLKWREQNKEKIHAKYLKDKEKMRKRDRHRRYRLTPEAFDALRDAQGGACAVCREPFSKEPHVDHCHATGLVRGLLCGDCNLGIGRFKDSPERLAAAIAYLHRHVSVRLTLTKEA